MYVANYSIFAWLIIEIYRFYFTKKSPIRKQISAIISFATVIFFLKLEYWNASSLFTTIREVKANKTYVEWPPFDMITSSRAIASENFLEVAEFFVWLHWCI